MARVQIKWNPNAMRELRTSPEVLADVEARAERVAAACGPGYVTQSEISGGRGRARAVVITGDMDAIRDNARRNTLVANIDAGR